MGGCPTVSLYQLGRSDNLNDIEYLHRYTSIAHHLNSESIFSGTLCRCNCGDKNESESATDKKLSEEGTTLRNRKATSHNGLDSQMDGAHMGATGHGMRSSGKCDRCHNHWKPLLLIIPLRLGLSEMNSVYHSQLKVGWQSHEPPGGDTNGRGSSPVRVPDYL